MPRLLSYVLIINYVITLCNSGVIDWTVKKPKMCVHDDNYSRPETESIELAVRISIVELYDINEELMQFGLQIFLTYIWKDPLLNLEGVNLTKTEDLPEHVVKCLWKPDIIFFNCKEARLFDSTVPNVVYKILPRKKLYHFSRYHLMISCQMEFKNYPMDSQLCILTLQFLASRNTESEMTWMSKSTDPDCRRMGDVDIFDGVRPQQFWMDHPSADIRRKNYASGNTTQLILKINFNRYLTAAVINTYMPSFLVVCLSFVSFWLDVSAVPGRVTLGVTALLTLSTQMVSARTALPSVSYMTALDVWLFGCLLLVFMSLVEFTLANSWSRSTNTKQLALGDNYVLKPQEQHRVNEAWSSGSVAKKEVANDGRSSSGHEISPTSVIEKRKISPLRLVFIEARKFENAHASRA